MSSEKRVINILIIEDEYINALYLKRLLEQYDSVNVRIAGTGEKGVQEALTAPPHLILMDIILGEGIDGITAARTIQQSHPIPVIYITASTDPGTKALAGRTKMVEYLRKPINEESFLQIIEKFISTLP